LGEPGLRFATAARWACHEACREACPSTGSSTGLTAVLTTGLTADLTAGLTTISPANQGSIARAMLCHIFSCAIAAA